MTESELSLNLKMSVFISKLASNLNDYINIISFDTCPKDQASAECKNWQKLGYSTYSVPLPGDDNYVNKLIK